MEIGKVTFGTPFVGCLNSEALGKSFLLNSVELQSTNNETIHDLFSDSMKLLWSHGVLYKNVYLFVTDVAHYIMTADGVLKALFTRMLRVMCPVHALHRITEKVQDLYYLVNHFIVPTKITFVKSLSQIAKFEELNPNLSLPIKPVSVC